MRIDPDLIRDLLLQVLPDAELEIKDTTADGRHYELVVTSSQFNGLSMIAQHKIVYAALHKYIDSGALHAVSLKTKIKSAK